MAPFLAPCDNIEDMLRLGIILTVTGILAIGHYFSGNGGPLPKGADLIIGIVFIVLGVPLLVVAVRT